MEIFLVAVIIVAILFSEAHRSKNKKHKDREKYKDNDRKRDDRKFDKK